jgi:hypothetical protein
MSQREVVLDPMADNLVRPEYHLVETEVEFLRAAVEATPLWVRGERLCSWAREVGIARHWCLTELESPTKELLRLCPTLSLEQAEIVLRRLGRRVAEVQRPLDLPEVLTHLLQRYDTELWLAKPDRVHAARWLLWYAEHGRELAPEEHLLVHELAAEWSAGSDTLLRQAYNVMSPEDAWSAFCEWFGLRSTERTWPSHPTIEPSTWTSQRLRQEWNELAVTTRGAFFDDLLSRRSPESFLRIAARTALRYFKANPRSLTRVTLEHLLPYLSHDEREQARALLPPQDPGEPPESFEGLVNWFTCAYLPFRCWSGVTDPAYQGRVRQLGRAFGLWYLSYYIKARMGAPGSAAAHLSWAKAAELGQDPTVVTLLVVLDGLGYTDAETLREQIRAQGSTRLDFDEFTVALAPVPTITEIAKQALLSGTSPARSMAEDQQQLGTIERFDQSVISALNEALPGHVVIWSLLEPDRTYHQQSQSAAVNLHTEVAAKLQSLAKRIVAVAHAVRESQRLRVVITTDHGRLLSAARRNHRAPAGMRVHGRAARGAIAMSFPKDGLTVEGDVAYLHPSWYALPEPCAVLLTDEAFLTEDGREGTELFAHGGVYPEEVLIPWMVLSRDRVLQPIKAVLRGRGKADYPGQARLEVSNPNEVTIRLLRFRVQRIGLELPLSRLIGALQKWEASIPMPSWPPKRELTQLTAILDCALPNGDHRELPCLIELETDEMYEREDILRALDL